jgi:hypothetical protein
MKFKEILNKEGIELFGKRKELIEKYIENFDEFDLELIREFAENKE